MTHFLRLGPFIYSEFVKLYKIHILCTNELLKFLLSELKFDLKERWLESRSLFRNILTPFSIFSSVKLSVILYLVDSQNATSRPTSQRMMNFPKWNVVTARSNARASDSLYPYARYNCIFDAYFIVRWTPGRNAAC